MTVTTVTDVAYEQVLKLNPGEVVFHQATKDVLDSV